MVLLVFVIVGRLRKTEGRRISTKHRKSENSVISTFCQFDNHIQRVKNTDMSCFESGFVRSTSRS